jgi:hypothetical protein
MCWVHLVDWRARGLACSVGGWSTLIYSIWNRQTGDSFIVLICARACLCSGCWSRACLCSGCGLKSPRSIHGTACAALSTTTLPHCIAAAAVSLQVRQSLGPSDDIEAGTKALLAQEGVVEEDFDLEVRPGALGACHVQVD